MADHPAGGPAIPGSRRSARVANMATKVDDVDGDYILMDYCKFDNLASQLKKAAVDMPPNGTERWLPESVLWLIFDCLVKGCMAMQCPPRYVPGNVNLAPAPAPGAPPPAIPLATDGTLLPEVVAPGVGNAAGHMGLVHFDLVRSPHTYPISFKIRPCYPCDLAVSRKCSSRFGNGSSLGSLSLPGLENHALDNQG